MKRFYLFCKRSFFNYVLGTVKKQYPKSLRHGHYGHDVYLYSNEEMVEVVGYLPIEKQNELIKKHPNWSDWGAYEVCLYLGERGYNQKSVQRLHEWIVVSKAQNKETV